MKNKGILVSLLMMAVVAIPSLAGAQDATSTTKQGWFGKLFNRQVRQEVKDNRQEFKDDRAEAVKDFRETRKEIRQSTSTATGTARMKEIQGKIKEEKEALKEKLAGFRTERLTGYVQAMAIKLSNAISIVERSINHLTNGIIAKLDASGKNTQAIKDKLAAAQVNVNEAKQALENAKNSLISDTASSTTMATSTAKTKYTEARAVYATIVTKIQAARQKINEALRLIKEIPGVRKIESGATPTPTASPVTTTSPAVTATTTN